MATLRLMTALDSRGWTNEGGRPTIVRSAGRSSSWIMRAFMDWNLIIGILLRWMHILAAITAVGGTIFARLALVPSLGVLSEDARNKLHEAIRQHWARPVQMAITFLIVSGVINIIVIEKS